MSVEAAAAVVASIAAAVTSYFAWSTIRAADKANDLANLVVRIEHRPASGHTALNELFVVENLGPATARDVRISISHTDGGSVVCAGPDDQQDEASDTLIISIPQLSPRASIERITATFLSSPTWRICVSLKWSDGSGDREESMTVEI